MESIEEFIDRRSGWLLRAAWLLTGNWASAEDLVQTTLVQTWRQWDRIEADAKDGYVRRVLMNSFLTSHRRRWKGELPMAVMPDQVARDDFATSELRQVIRSALDGLPPKQRAVVVLRYFNDLSEADAARALHCSVGNVKSQTSRALAKLRATPELAHLLEEVGHE